MLPRLFTTQRRAGAALAAIALSGALAACDAATTAPALVAVRGQRTAVVIRNTTNAPMYTFAVGRHAAAAVDWFPCVDPVVCPPIDPGAVATRPVAFGVQRIGETQALVYWWHAVRRADGMLVPGRVRHTVVELPER